MGPLGSLGMRAPRVPPQLAALVVYWLVEPPSLQGWHSGANMKTVAGLSACCLDLPELRPTVMVLLGP